MQGFCIKCLVFAGKDYEHYLCIHTYGLFKTFLFPLSAVRLLSRRFVLVLCLCKLVIQNKIYLNPKLL